ncbi:MAG: redoxin domain-containing protein [Planctomycetota bacterium]|nr:redoxin domain-containing protein [Planctomycetota bacterium]
MQTMPHLQRLWSENKEKGLVVIALTAEEREKVEPFIKQSNYTFPVALDDSRKTNQLYGIKGIPTVYVINAVGKVVWQGHSGDKNLDAVVKQVVSEAEEFAPDKLSALPFELKLEKELSKKLSTAQKHLEKKEFAKALKEAEKFAKSDKAAEEEKKDGAFLVNRIELHGEKLLKKAELLIEKKAYVEAEELLNAIEKAYAGTDVAKRASESERKMKSDKVISKELSAAKLLKGALDKIQSGKKDEGIETLKKVIADYADTEAAKEAQKKLDEMQGEEEREKKEEPKGESGATPKKP